MKSTYSTHGDMFTINLDVEDLDDSLFATALLTIINEAGISKVICDFSSVGVIQQADIKNIDLLVKLFKFNNVDTIVCGINAYSASVLFHFLDDFSFKTALNIQRAIDDFEYN